MSGQQVDFLRVNLLSVFMVSIAMITQKVPLRIICRRFHQINLSGTLFLFVLKLGRLDPCKVTDNNKLSFANCKKFATFEQAQKHAKVCHNRICECMNYEPYNGDLPLNSLLWFEEKACY